MKKGKIFFICGVSGSGHGTTIKEILKLGRKDIVYIPSYTTRIIRPGESQGNPYFFINNDEFLKSLDNGEFLEYAFIHKIAYYGTKEKNLMDVYNKGIIAIKEIEMQGLQKIVESGAINGLYKSIFMDLAPDIMRKRILGRSKLPEQEVKNRLQSREMEIRIAQRYCDHIINADDTIENNLNKVLEIIDGY